jgi:predicted DNA-binding protein YlxM (UPF0122 family)
MTTNDDDDVAKRGNGWQNIKEHKEMLKSLDEKFKMVENDEKKEEIFSHSHAYSTK